MTETVWSFGNLRHRLAGVKAVIGDDGVIGNADQIVDERRRRLAAE